MSMIKGMSEELALRATSNKARRFRCAGSFESRCFEPRCLEPRFLQDNQDNQDFIAEKNLANLVNLNKIPVQTNKIPVQTYFGTLFVERERERE